MKKTLSLTLLRLKHFYKSNIFLTVLTLFLIAISFEIFYRITRTDTQILLDFLYLEGSAYNEIYAPSHTSRIYKLKPNVDSVIKERKAKTDSTVPKKFKVVTNNAGFRNNFDITAKTDKYRIVILGGSNAFGFCVDNSGTYSFFMQKALEEKYPGKFEVLNAGIPAYVMAQKIAYAEEIIEKYNPDMILLQTYNNGRSAFTMGFVPQPSLFYDNKELFAQNIPLLFFRNFITRKIHCSLVFHSAFYRVLFSKINAALINKESAFCQRMRETFKEEADYLANKNNKKAFEKFIENTKGSKIPIILFDPTALSKKDLLTKKEGYWHMNFANYSKPKPYVSIHPAKEIYAWYSEKIIFLLEDLLRKI